MDVLEIELLAVQAGLAEVAGVLPARDVCVVRVVAHGLANVSPLKKDDDGIWRGTAQQEGRPVQIAVDYKGNVVATAQQ